MDSRCNAPAVPLRAFNPIPWQDRAAIAWPLLLAVVVMLVWRGNLGPALLNENLSIYWVWADQFTAELAHGVLYPRWLAASDAGLGTPVFYFYPPGAFYLSGLFGLLGASTYASLIGTFAVAFAASGLACWYWLKERSNHPLFGAAFFVAAPYHLLNYTDRGALAESLATALIPVTLIGLRRIAEKRRGFITTGLGYAALIATHLPLALLVSVFLIAPYVLVHRRSLRDFAVALGAGIGLSAIYLLPALALGSYHDVGQLYRTPSLQTGYWSLFSGHWGDSTFVIIFAILAAIVLAAAPMAFMRRDRWALLAVALAIIIAGLVPFLWSLPLLKDVQFPYRALPIAEFALATAIARLPRDPGPWLFPIGLPLILSLVVLPGFHPSEPDFHHLQQVHPDTYEYLPRGVIKPGQTNAKLADVLSSRVPPPSIAGMRVEPHFYFPSWSCGQEEPRTQLLMHGPACRPRIILTGLERLGALISAAAGLLLIIVEFRRRQKSQRSSGT